MKLKLADTRRILTFCLDRPCHIEMSEEGERCLIKIFPPHDRAKPLVFAAATFEQALHAAAEAGAVRAECIERQIAFLRSFSEPAFDAGAAKWSATTPPPVEPASPMPPARRKVALSHYRGLAEFRYQIRKFVSFSERAARQAELEPVQHQVLLAIRGLPTSKRADIPTLAERMCMDTAACEQVVRSLLARDLVQWTSNAADRRQQLLSLTPSGKALIRKLTALHRDQMLAVGPTFVQALGAILSSLEEDKSEPAD